MNKNKIFKLTLMMLFAMLLSCSQDVKLKKADFISLYVNAEGTFCAEQGEDIEMPFKIVFLIDVSGSNSRTTEGATDPVQAGCAATNSCESMRSAAYLDLLEELIPTEEEYNLEPESPSNFHFSVITFNQRARNLTYRVVNGNREGRFYNPKYQGDSDWRSLTTDSILGTRQQDYSLTYGAGVTNYLGAFEAAEELIRNDIKNSTATRVKRTKYMIIFLSDGQPDDGKVDEGPENYFFPAIQNGNNIIDQCIQIPNDPEYNDAPAGSMYCSCGYSLQNRNNNGLNYNESNYSKVFFNDTFTDMFCVGKYGEYLTDQIFDDNESVFHVISRSRDGDGRYRFAHQSRDENGAIIVSRPLQVTWNTAFYNVPVAGERHLQKIETARWILSRIASHGNGQFVDFTQNNQSISFVNNFHFEPGIRQYQLYGFFAHNENTAFTGEGDTEMAPDSDGDSIPDFIENQLGTNAFSRDTDNDGIRDSIEVNLLHSNVFEVDFDCTNLLQDDDNDLLNACEERELKLDDQDYDFDNDGMPDGIEIFYGLSANASDRTQDYDFDRTTNFQELSQHRNPMLPFDKETSHPFNFTMSTYRSSEGKNCYDIKMTNIRLVATENGNNRIYFQAVQVPEDDPEQKGILSTMLIDINFDDVREGKNNNIIDINNSFFMHIKNGE